MLVRADCKNNELLLFEQNLRFGQLGGGKIFKNYTSGTHDENMDRGPHVEGHLSYLLLLTNGNRTIERIKTKRNKPKDLWGNMKSGKNKEFTKKLRPN